MRVCVCRGVMRRAAGCVAVWRAAQAREAACPCARSGPGGCGPLCPRRRRLPGAGPADALRLGAREPDPGGAGGRCRRPVPPHAGGLTDSAPRPGTGRAGAGREVGGGAARTALRCHGSYLFIQAPKMAGERRWRSWRRR